jgi:hypothetical protein
MKNIFATIIAVLVTGYLVAQAPQKMCMPCSMWLKSKIEVAKRSSIEPEFA